VSETSSHKRSPHLVSWLAVLASIFLFYLFSIPWVEAYSRKKYPLSDDPVWVQRYSAPWGWLWEYSPRHVQRLMGNYQGWCYRKCHVIAY